MAVRMLAGCGAQQQVLQIQASLARAEPLRLVGERRAIVACLLRRSSLGGAPQMSTSSLDIFFILRASAKNDHGVTGASAGSRWAGQVGFPGGHAHDGEGDHEAVVRECFEEVGLSLDRPGAYRFLGCVAERKVSTSLVVACRVYEQVLPEIPRHVQAEEVAACAWAPLAELCSDDCAQPLYWSRLRRTASTCWDGMPSVMLPIMDICCAEGVAAENVQGQFVLWGLTLRIVSDLLCTSGLRSSPIQLQREASNFEPEDKSDHLHPLAPSSKGRQRSCL
mmetsp:Transcript_98328/g.194859  ORF Transcript_98328/g.194859 Transcript_98328/m.194859 type:complete len:279 (+) Transcript_98328:88-924(+)